MKKTCVYLHQQGFDFYLSEHELLPEELFYAVCNEEDVLLGTYETVDNLADKLRQLFADGYELMPCNEYDEIKIFY